MNKLTLGLLPAGAWVPAATGMSKLKGGSYVVDDRCDIDNSVGAGAGEQLYDGGVNPYPAGDCHYRSTVKHHSGAKTFGIIVK